MSKTDCMKLVNSYLESVSKFIGHYVVKYGVDARRHVVENTRTVGEERVHRKEYR